MTLPEADDGVWSKIVALFMVRMKVTDITFTSQDVIDFTSRFDGGGVLIDDSSEGIKLMLVTQADLEYLKGRQTS